MIVLGLVAFVITLLTIYALNKCFRLTHIIQLLICFVFIAGLCTSVHFIFGNTTMLYLLNGLAVGFGIALQPLFKNIVNGLVFDSTRIKGEIEVGNFRGEIKRVGMIHTWLLGEDGKLMMINNDLLASKPVKLHSCKL